MPTELDNIINELDPTKAKCPACLQYKNKNEILLGIYHSYCICKTCNIEFDAYCGNKLICEDLPCQQCITEWIEYRQRKIKCQHQTI